MKFTTASEVDLGHEKVGKLLFMLAVPAILSQIVNLLYNVVDRMYIGHIQDVGAIALTGVGVCLPIIMIVSAFACLVGMGGAPRASIYMGKQDNPTAEKIMGNCFIALIIISLTLTVCFSNTITTIIPGKFKNNCICQTIYGYLCLRNHFCPNDTRNECLYFLSGIL